MSLFVKVYDGTGEGNCLPLHARHSRRLDMVNSPKPVIRRNSNRSRHSIDWIAIQIALAAGLAIVVLASLAIAIQIGNTLGGVQ